MIDLESIKSTRSKIGARPDFVGLYLKGENKSRFKKYCLENNLTYSALVNALLDNYFNEIKYKGDNDGNTSTS